MEREYWSDDVDPEQDDAEYVPYPEDDPAEGDLDDETVDEVFEEVHGIIDTAGVTMVLDAVAEYMQDMPRPFHRLAKQVSDLAGKTQRAEGAVEEAMQTRGLKR